MVFFFIIIKMGHICRCCSYVYNDTTCNHVTLFEVLKVYYPYFTNEWKGSSFSNFIV